MGELTGSLAKLVFGGKIAASETWACSIFLAGGEGEVADASLLIAGYQAPIRDWFLRPSSYINKSATLEFIKLNAIDKPTGHYSDESEANTLFQLPPLAAPTANWYAAPQITQALTWHTDKDRGRASHGRIYPPGSAMSSSANHVAADGLTSTMSTQAMADSAQELLAEINNVSAILTSCVWSHIGQTARAIERVSVGRAVDTQLRRRKALLETRMFAAAAV